MPLTRRWHEQWGMRNRVGASIVFVADKLQRINEGSELAQALIRYADEHYALDYDITYRDKGAIIEYGDDGLWYVRTWYEYITYPEVLGAMGIQDMPVVQSTFAGSYIAANDFANDWIYKELPNFHENGDRSASVLLNDNNYWDVSLGMFVPPDSEIERVHYISVRRYSDALDLVRVWLAQYDYNDSWIDNR